MKKSSQVSKPEVPIAPRGWWEIIGKLITFGGPISGLIVFAINYFNPIGSVDLTIWVQQEIPIVFPSDIGPLPLTLKYDDENISHATVLKIKIYNSGNTAIGEDGQWPLVLKTGDNSKVVLLDKPITNPSNLNIAIVDEGGASDHLAFNVGLLNPNDSIDLRIIIIDPQDPNKPEIIGDARIPYLSEPLVTRKSLEERVRDAYANPIILIIWPIFFSILMWESYKNKKIVSIWTFTLEAISSLFMGGIAALFVSSVIAWIFTYILLLQLIP